MSHPRMRPRWLGLTAILVTILAGCGGYRVAADGPLHYVGTINQSGDGTVISTQYWLGELVYGPDEAPPRAVLEACNTRYAETGAGEDYVQPSRTADKTAYSPGRIIVTYRRGSLPFPIELDAQAVVRVTERWTGVVAIDVNGEWRCGQEPLETTLGTLGPGHKQSYQIWVLSNVLTRAQPKVTQALRDTWQFDPESIGAGVLGADATVTTSGPGAARCNREDVLMLYAHLPFSVQSEFGSPGSSVACTKPGG